MACLCAGAMDRFEALSQVESGNNDRAVGASGEVSRYQIMPDEWKRYSLRGDCPTNQSQATRVSFMIQMDRTVQFEIKFNRRPTDEEFYILWNRPADFLGHRKAGRKELERAQRFANLCSLK